MSKLVNHSHTNTTHLPPLHDAYSLTSPDLKLATQPRSRARDATTADGHLLTLRVTGVFPPYRPRRTSRCKRKSPRSGGQTDHVPISNSVSNYCLKSPLLVLHQPTEVGRPMPATTGTDSSVGTSTTVTIARCSGRGHREHATTKTPRLIILPPNGTAKRCLDRP